VLVRFDYSLIGLYNYQGTVLYTSGSSTARTDNDSSSSSSSCSDNDSDLNANNTNTNTNSNNNTTKNKNKRSVRQRLNRSKSITLTSANNSSSSQSQPQSQSDTEDEDNNNNNNNTKNAKAQSLPHPLTKTPEVRRRNLEACAITICWTRLTDKQCEIFEQFRAEFGDDVQFNAAYTNITTHLITSAQLFRGAKNRVNKRTNRVVKKQRAIVQARTVKYFQAIAAGVWVLTFDWIVDCLASRKILDEDMFEVLGDKKSVGDCNACRISRQLRMNKFVNNNNSNSNADDEYEYDHGLFCNIYVCVASEFQMDGMHSDLRKIFRLAGAKIFNLLPYHWLRHAGKYLGQMKLNSKVFVFVYDSDYHSMTQKQTRFCQTMNVRILDYKLVFEALSNYKTF
jgi:hypothetical protein